MVKLSELSELTPAKPGELRALLWSFAYFFFLLSSYYVLRPLRDEMGVAAGVGNLQWLFTATFFVMLVVSPLYGAVVAKLPRHRLIPAIYHFLALNLLAFWALLYFDINRTLTAQAFFVWVSVFNLFAVSIFWSFLADLFSSEQAKRLFGFIAAGGTIGTLLGPLLIIALAGSVGPTNLLIIATLLLEIAVVCAMRLEREVPKKEQPEEKAPEEPLGGSWIAGLLQVARSPYLAGIALWVALLSLAGTFLYFMQANVVASLSSDPAVRTRIFATIDLSVSITTILVQLFLAGRILPRFGVGRSLAVTPVVFTAGFAALAISPVVMIVLATQALQRASNFSISNLARETLFTVIDREAKYKAKNVIDLVVFRGGDVAFSWLFATLRTGLSLELSVIALITLPVTAAWAILSLALGRGQASRTAPVKQP